LDDASYEITRLVELQLLESSILRKLNEINVLKKNEKLQKLQKDLSEINEKLELSDKELAGLEHERKKLEDMITLQNEKIKKNEEKLFSGTITSSKELLNYQEEIKFLKQNNDNVESKAIELMISIDEWKPKIKEIEKSKARIDFEIEMVKKEAGEKTKVISDAVKRLREKRATVISKIPKDALAKYEETKAKKGGIAVAVLKDRFCDICNMEIPTGDAEKIKDLSKLYKCPLCGRMLIMYRAGIDEIKAGIEN
jgi:predicted  nucleic acid-binding Zn-ribbon protein